MRKCAKNKAPIQFCIRNAGIYPTSDNPFRDRNRAPRYFPFPPTPKIPLTVETGTTRFTFLPPKSLLRPKTELGVSSTSILGALRGVVMFCLEHPGRLTRGRNVRLGGSLLRTIPVLWNRP